MSSLTITYEDELDFASQLNWKIYDILGIIRNSTISISAFKYEEALHQVQSAISQLEKIVGLLVKKVNELRLIRKQKEQQEQRKKHETKTKTEDKKSEQQKQRKQEQKPKTEKDTKQVSKTSTKKQSKEQ